MSTTREEIWTKKYQFATFVALRGWVAFEIVDNPFWSFLEIYINKVGVCGAIATKVDRTNKSASDLKRRQKMFCSYYCFMGGLVT